MAIVTPDTPGSKKRLKASERKFRLDNGQWVKFELPADDSLLLVMVNGTKATGIKPTDADEVEVLKKKMKTAADGRFVGIYIGAAKTPTGGSKADGTPEYAFLPACVVPQRAVLGPNGEQNLQTLWDGRGVTVMFDADTVENLDPLLLREDIPKHRDATCHPDWNPRR